MGKRQRLFHILGHSGKLGYQVLPDLEWWVKAVSSENKSVFDYVTDNAEELSDGEETDNEWKMEIVQTDEDGEEKILAVSTIWESDLNNEQ